MIGVPVSYEIIAYLIVTNLFSQASSRGFMVKIFMFRSMICVKFTLSMEWGKSWGSQYSQLFQNHLLNNFFYSLNLLDPKKH